MPMGMQTARGLQATGNVDNDSMCALGCKIFMKAQEEVELKWPLLQTYLETFTVAPRERERRLP